MWTVSAEMVLVRPKSRTAVLLAVEQHPVAALGSDNAADEPLGERVGPSRQLHPMPLVEHGLLR
jgi:hypothetical protein